MKIKIFKLKILYKYWPILFILLVWLIFAYPYFLRGAVPFPSGYLVNFFAPWNAVAGFAGPFKNGATPDVITQIYPWKALVIDLWKQGTIPMWNPYGFSGTPLLANYQSGVFAPVNFLYFILPFIDAWSIAVLLQPLFAGFFMYIYVRSLGINREGSSISSIAFMFCGFIVTWMSYQTLAFAVLFLPLSLFAIEKFYRTKKLKHAILLSLTIPLSFFSGHFQTSLYFLVFVLLYTLFRSLSYKDIKSYVLSSMSIVLGLLLSAPQILPSVELYLHSVRSEIFSAVEIIPWTYLPTFLAPDFYGNPVTRNDWLGHYAEWNGYLGLIPLMLGFYSLVLIKSRKIVVFFFAITIISVLVAFKSPLQGLLVNFKIPVLSTSAASRIIVLVSFSFAVLSGFGLEKMIMDIKKKNFKPIYIWLTVFGLIFSILWGIILLKLFIPQDKVQIAFSNLKLPTLIFASFLVIIAFSVFIKNKKFLFPLSLLIIILVAFDLLRFAAKWQPFDSRKFVYPQLPISKFLSNIPPADRAFGNYGAEVSVTYRVSSIEGYDPLYIGRYGEFIAAASDGDYHKAQRSGVVFPKKGQYTQDILNYLGVKYIIHKIADGRNVWAYPFWEYPVDYFTPVYRDDSYEVYQNQKAFSRALIVGKYSVENNNKQLLNKIFNSNTNLKQEVFLEENLRTIFDKDIKGEAAIKKYFSNEIEIEASSSGKSILVLSDPFYPGWKAYVDNLPRKIYRANYAFRAVEVPKGKHVIKFTYEPESFKIGILLSVFGVIGMFGQVLYLRRR